MRKKWRPAVATGLALALMSAGVTALASGDYVSIRELRETLPERWVGDYVVQNGAHKQLKKGDTVFVDVPIVVPEVDKVPVVRITWDPPVEEPAETLEWNGNTWAIKVANYHWDQKPLPLLAENTTFDPDLPWEETPAITVEQLRKWLPFMRDKELTWYAQRSYGDSETNGYQRLYFYTTYHGIPHLVAAQFYHSVESERGAFAREHEIGTVPQTMISVAIKRPDQFTATIYTSREVGVDIEDIPLLPFEEILKALEQRVEAGYAYSLNELRFGYMVFIDPEKKSEEFVLLPVWAAKGRTRGELSLPFDLKTDQAVRDRIGYNSNCTIVINAQTGQAYDFESDKRPDRLYVPHIITWDEVK